jgi:hypothetical protein
MRNIHRYRSRDIRNTIALVILFVAIMFAFAYGSKRGEAFTCDPTVVHTVQYGDTLWRIAETNCDGNIQNATDKLVATYGNTIQLGDRIYLPTNQDCNLTTTQEGQIHENC